MLHSDSVKLVPVICDWTRVDRCREVENVTEAEITIKILETINILDDKDMQQFHEEHFQKNIKNKNR